MKPILYPANESQFNTNGLGRLPDATSCIVTEERNGKYELEMEYPITGLHFADIKTSRFIYAKPADGKKPQAFRIYSISKPINGRVEISAEHVSYQLSHIPVTPFEEPNVSAALAGLKSNAAEACPFDFWTDKSTIANFEVKEPASIRSLLGGTQNSILDVFGGGDYEFDMYEVKLHQNRGYDRGVTLRYGKNITDIKQEENIQNTYTGVMPFWKGGSDDDETIVMLTERVLHSANAANFPYQRTIPLDLSSEWQDAPTEAQLKARALSYMTANNIGVPSVSISVDFIALWQTEEYKNIANLERVNLCDSVTVEFPKLGISAKAKVVKTTYDVLSERYRTIELGEAKANLAKSISTDIQGATAETIEKAPSVSFIQKSINRATTLLRGGLGGYVVMSTNANGEPQEILIMDTDDIQTAVNVIRINKNGIGFSSSGYEGPFQSAWTIDGHFVADFIDTGNLNASLITTGSLLADLIKTGRIESNNGQVYFDLDNNELHCDELVSTNSGNTTIASIGVEPVTGYNSMRVYTSNTEAYALYLRGGSSSSESQIRAKENGLNVSAYVDDGRLLSGNSSKGWAGFEVKTDGRVVLFSTERSQATNARIILNPPYWHQGHSGDSYDDGAIYIASPGTIYLDSLNAKVSNNLLVNNVVTKGTKSRQATTQDYNDRLLYCYETPSPIFGDIGSGVTDEDGICYIDFDDVFHETVRTDIDYQVFLQKEGQGDLWVDKKEFSGFVVKGTPNLKFSWEVKVKQKGFESLRLEDPSIDGVQMDVVIGQTDPINPYLDEIESIIKEQEELLLYETA